MDRQGTINTYQILVSTFTELLTAAVHTILAERDVYPKTSFLKARKWGLAVYQSRHPGVIRWVEDAIDAVEQEILKGSIRQTSLVILSPSAVPLERFVFSTESFPALPPSEAHVPTVTNSVDSADETPEDSEGHQIPGVSMTDLAAQFRGLLSRICTISGRLPALPPDCSFTMAIELRNKPEGEPPIGRAQPFIPSDPKTDKADRKSSRVTPIRNVDIGLFEMEAWIEESHEKLDIVTAMQTAPDPAESAPTPEEEKVFDPLLEAMEGKTFMS